MSRAPLSPNPTLPRSADVVIVGAGLGGLLTAALLATTDRRVLVLDGRRAGGRARTDEQHGFRFNLGPHALYDGGPAPALLRRLGVRWSGGPPATEATAVRIGAAAHPLPASPVRLLASGVLSVREKAQLARAMRHVTRRTGDDDALPSTQPFAVWLDDQGLTGRARLVIEMFARISSYSADLDALSTPAALTQIRLGLAGVTYIDGGWQHLVDQLVDIVSARGGTTVEHAAVQRVTDTPGGWQVETVAGAVDAAAVVLAAGGPREAVRLLGHDPGWGDLGEPVTAACLDLGVRRLPDHRPLFGLDAPLYLSVHCPPARLAPAGHGIVHVARYGATDATADEATLRGHAALAGVAPSDIAHDRFLARMTVTHTLPRAATNGLPGRPPTAVPERPGLAVVGDWVGPVGMLTDAVAASAEQAAATIGLHLDARDARDAKEAGATGGNDGAAPRTAATGSSR